MSNHVLSSRDKRLCFAEMIQIHVKMLQSFLDHNILDGADPPAPLQKEHVELVEDLWRVLGRIHKEKLTDTRTVSSKFEALHSELLTWGPMNLQHQAECCWESNTVREYVQSIELFSLLCFEQ